MILLDLALAQADTCKPRASGDDPEVVALGGLRGQ